MGVTTKELFRYLKTGLLVSIVFFIIRLVLTPFFLIATGGVVGLILPLVLVVVALILYGWAIEKLAEAGWILQKHTK